jgi:hypothetical protein
VSKQIYKLAETSRVTRGLDGAIALDIRQGQLFSFNLVGSRILELLERGLADSDIEDEISREFGVDREVAQNDHEEFLRTLRKYRLIEEVQPETQSE